MHAITLLSIVPYLYVQCVRAALLYVVTKRKRRRSRDLLGLSVEHIACPFTPSCSGCMAWELFIALNVTNILIIGVRRKT